MEKLPLKVVGRSLREFMPLKPAEKILLDACRMGKGAPISKNRPEQATEQNTIRATFLRFLALGGDEETPVHDVGVRIFGAWIDGILDLDGASLPHSLMLISCHLSEIRLADSNVHGMLSFKGSYIEVLNAFRLVCSGFVQLSNGFTASGRVNLHGAYIGDNLLCEDSKFNSADDAALSCVGAVIKGDVFLNNGFTAIGSVCLDVVQIGGSLYCDNAVFNSNQQAYALQCVQAIIKGGVYLDGGFIAIGTVCFKEMQIGAGLYCNGATFDGGNDYALQVEGITANALHFHKLKSVKGVISFAASRISNLKDDISSWMGVLYLDGFVYDRLIGDAPTDAKSRIAWLEKQCPSDLGLESNGIKFTPQPWRQLQKVLREMGHMEDARLVGIAFEEQLRKAKLIKHCILHSLFGFLVGYGYRPFRLLIFAFFIWLSCGAFYSYAAYEGVFAPSNPLVFQNPDYDVCKVDKDASKFESNKLQCSLPSTQGAGNWYLCSELREEYTGFSPWAYSLDLILPLVDLQQERDWSPMIPTPKSTLLDELKELTLKHVTRLVMWFEILFGWMASLLLVAVVSGLTKRQEE